MESILIVDDEDFFRNRLVKAFTNRGYKAFGAANFDEAVKAVREKKPDMAVVDLKMPGKTGLDVIKEAKSIDENITILVLTGYGSIATAIDAVKLGAFSYLSKPADVDEILAAFQKEPSDEETNLTSSDITSPSLARAEWEHINRVMTDCDGNISKTAKRLGIHRRSLQRKLSKYPPKS